jgi:hypothetical protein
MSEFVGQGYIRFDEVIPKDLCDIVNEDIFQGQHSKHTFDMGGISLDKRWKGQHLQEVMNVPVIAGAIESLVGPHPRFDHCHAHRTEPGRRSGFDLHQDAVYDKRFENFDIQLSIFFTDVTHEMGGTRFVPGTHFRRIHTRDACRYHNIRGQKQTVCKAGTVVLWHHNLWHGARNNNSEDLRTMFKVRLNPQVPQLRLWDCRDLDHPDIEKNLRLKFPWMGGQDRIEEINRILLWRSLTGNPNYDHDSYLTRIESTGRKSHDYH